MGAVLVSVCIIGGLFGALSFRLFRTALRSAGAEGWLAVFFLTAAIAMPARVFLARSSALDPELRIVGALAVHGLLAMGLCAFTVFVVRVFRTDRWGAWIAAAVLIGALMMGPLVLIFVGAHRASEHPVALAVGLMRSLPFLWGLVESVLYHARMRRRRALGLADPVVTNRFLLFAIWNGALFALMAVTIGLRAWAEVATEGGILDAGDPTARSLLLGVRIAVLGLGGAAAISLWLSFFPPAAWLRRLQSAGPAEQGAA